MVSDLVLTDLRSVCLSLPHLGHPLCALLSQHWHAITIGHTHYSYAKRQFTQQHSSWREDTTSIAAANSAASVVAPSSGSAVPSLVRQRSSSRSAEGVAGLNSDLGSAYFSEVATLPPALLKLAASRRQMWTQYSKQLQRVYLKVG